MSARLRKSINELQPDDVFKLSTAFSGIMAKGYSDPNSYFTFAGWHGVGVNVCQHHGQLFLSWHRKCVRMFEDGLRSIAGCEDVTLPYWDATSSDPKAYNVPDWLTKPPFDSYDLSTAFPSDLWKVAVLEINKKFGYAAPQFSNGYQTYRRPDFPAGTYTDLVKYGVFNKAQTAMAATTYDEFSNYGSNTNIGVEYPHDYLHALIGGVTPPVGQPLGWMSNPLTASFDPIFWFHHSNIERLFKIWQQKNNAITVDTLDAIKGPNIGTIRFNDPFPTTVGSSSALSYSLPSFSGTFADNIWEADVNYTAGSFTPITTLAAVAVEAQPMMAMKSHATMKPAHKAATATNMVKVQVEQIDRSHINGPFKVQVLSNGRKLVEMFAFQKGPSCQSCVEQKFFTVHEIVPASVIRPGDQLTVKIITFTAQGEAEATVDYGHPVVTISMMFQ